MTIKEKIGLNIKSLRKAYCETQEELANSIGVEKNTISNYENGIREAYGDILASIANHFGVSVNTIVSEDLNTLYKFNIDLRAYEKKIELVLPIVTSDKAMSNQHFKRAYKKHMDFYDTIHDGTYVFNLLDICFDEYEKAYYYEEIKEDVAVNMLAIETFVFSALSASSILCDDKSAVRNCIKKTDADNYSRRIESHIDEMKSWQDEISQTLEEEELQQEYLEYIKVLKKSLQWSELGYYYLALYYYYGIVRGNDNDLATNNRIGAELLDMLDKIGNPYAKRFIRFQLDALYGVNN